MLSPEHYVVLSPLARKDFKEILAYTLENWGSVQLEVYKTELNCAFSALAENPRLGRVIKNPLRDLFRRENILSSTASVAKKYSSFVLCIIKCNPPGVGYEIPHLS